MKNIFVKIITVCAISSMVGCASGYTYIKDDETNKKSETVQIIQDDLLLSRIPKPEDFFTNAKSFNYYGSEEIGLKGVEVVYENSEGLHDRWKNYVDLCKELGIWTVKDIDFENNWGYMTEDEQYKIMISCLEDSCIIDISVTNNVK